MPEKRHTAGLIFAAFYGFWLCFGNTMRIFYDLASCQKTVYIFFAHHVIPDRPPSDLYITYSVYWGTIQQISK